MTLQVPAFQLPTLVLLMCALALSALFEVGERAIDNVDTVHTHPLEPQRRCFRAEARLCIIS